MKIFKRMLTIILTLALCLQLLPVTAAQAASDFTIQDGVLIKYTGSGGDVIIPDSVTKIDDKVFSHCSKLKSVTIPSSVTEIGFEAFYECKNLTNVTLSEGLNDIDVYAFGWCTSLTSITIPDTVGTIHNYAFVRCTSLTDAVIGSGTISAGAFTYCTNLTNVVIGDGVASIGYRAFEGCTNLTSVTIGSGVGYIDANAFADCINLTNIDIPNDVEIEQSAFLNTGLELDKIGNKLTGAGMVAMLPSPPFKTIIPESISEVGYWSPHDAGNWSLPQSKEAIFKQICSLVEQLTNGKNSETERAKAIYDWVSTNISYDWEDYRGGESTSKGDAFYTYYYRAGVCENYTKLAHFMLTVAGLPVAHIDGVSNGLAGVGGHAWNAVYADERWIVFDATWNMWDISPNYHFKTDRISFRNGIFLETIRDDGSIDCQMWDLYNYPSDVIVPEGVTDITFITMDNLRNVTLPNSMTEISRFVFERCTNLTSVTIPASVTKIGNRAFTGCSSLTSIPISNNITEIGAEAFSYCTGLTSVTIPDSVTKLGEIAFAHCENLTSVTIPSSVTEIGMSAFFSCTSLKSVVIANGDAEIGELAFSTHYPLWGYLPISGLTIYSTAGGKVEKYCNENGISFVAVIAGFTDIPDTTANAWFAEAVNWAVTKGITTGTSVTTFSPYDTCTQAQIITFLYRTVGAPAVTGENIYTNSAVTSDKYYYHALLWAYQNGVVTDADLNPNSDCTRSDVVTYLWRLAGKPFVGSSAFLDVSASADYAQAVAWAVQQGVTAGTSPTTFSPNVTCTRAQIVTFLYRDRVA